MELIVNFELCDKTLSISIVLTTQIHTTYKELQTIFLILLKPLIAQVDMMTQTLRKLSCPIITILY